MADVSLSDTSQLLSQCAWEEHHVLMDARSYRLAVIHNASFVSLHPLHVTCLLVHKSRSF